MPLGAPKSAQQIVTVPYGTCMVTVQANGGSVTIEVLHGASPEIWVPAASTFTADGAITLFPTNNARLRITPAGGATWNIQGPGL